jgi:sulfoxide reductase heme-binding subunit YedZ
MTALLEEKVEAPAPPKKPVNKKKKAGQPRPVTHLVMLVTTVIACILASIYRPEADLREMISIGTGYYAILLIAITLLIGPYKLLRQRKNPVNIDLRRDIGIWAGINILIHVFCSLQLFEKGEFLLYFLTENGGVRTDQFGLGNDFGLLALLLLLPVWFTSNQISLKRLKGKRWKNLQRLTYLVFGFGVIHTILFQIYNLRETWFNLGLAVATLGVLLAQSIGIFLTLKRERQRREANNSPKSAALAIPAPVAELPGSDVARRRFLKIAGGAFVTGIAAGSAAALVVAATEKTTTGNSVAAAATTSATTTAAPTTTATAVATNTSSAAPSTVAATATTSATTTAATTKASSTTQAATTVATSGKVLATTANLGLGKALLFTTPDTGARAFVVRRKDGTVGCFSGVCTHEPVNLTFNETNQTLYCAKHNISFDTTNGNPSSMPARTALKKYTVSVDSSGNIIYGS